MLALLHLLIIICTALIDSQYPVGQFGKIYKATLVRGKSEKMTVAVKTIKKYKSEQETSNFLHEMGVMMDLIHPNVVHLYGIVQQGLIITCLPILYVY